MPTGKGYVLELILEDGSRSVRVGCPSSLIPSPGQYLLAGNGPDAPLPVPLIYTDSAPRGFIAAGAIPESWHPGQELRLRGPLGRGFTMPLSARKVGLVAFDSAPVRLKGLIRQSLKQRAAVVLLCDSSPDNLPDEVEVQPVSALEEILVWSDYLAIDVSRKNLNPLKEQLGKLKQFTTGKEIQVLVNTPVPCGGVADCAVCAVSLRSDWKLACKDGPVFDGREL